MGFHVSFSVSPPKNHSLFQLSGGWKRVFSFQLHNFAFRSFFFVSGGMSCVSLHSREDFSDSFSFFKGQLGVPLTHGIYCVL